MTNSLSVGKMPHVIENNREGILDTQAAEVWIQVFLKKLHNFFHGIPGQAPVKTLKQNTDKTQTNHKQGICTFCKYRYTPCSPLGAAARGTNAPESPEAHLYFKFW
jgi:hypothetical protein